MNIEKITTMQCAFHPDKFITEDIWAISLIREKGSQYGNEEVSPLRQHASIFLQELKGGTVKLTKLHGIHHIKNAPGKLTLQALSNQDTQINIPIRNSGDLLLAASYLVRISPRDQLKNPILDYAGKTWLVPVIKGHELLDIFAKQEKQIQVTKTPYWRFGNKNIFSNANRLTILAMDKIKQNFLYYPIFSNPQKLFFVGGMIALTPLFYAAHLNLFIEVAAICAPAMNIAPLPILLTTILKTAPYIGGSALISVGSSTSVTTIAEGVEDAQNKGHSCFTWARDRLIELDVPEIKTDLKAKSFDLFVAMTSLYLPDEVKTKKSEQQRQ